MEEKMEVIYYYLTKLMLTRRELEKLKYNDKIVKDCSFIMYGNITNISCRNIINIIKRNSKKISKNIQDIQSLQFKNDKNEDNILSISFAKDEILTTMDESLSDEKISKICENLDDLDPNVSENLTNISKIDCEVYDINETIYKSDLNQTLDVTDVKLNVDGILTNIYNVSHLNNKILPQQSSNCFPVKFRNEDKQPSFSDCKIYEGNFILNKYETNLIYKENKLIPGVYHFVIKEKFLNINNTCVLNIKQCNHSKKSNILTIYAYCAHPTCKIFKLKCHILDDESFNVDVYSSSINFSHELQLTRHVKGIERHLLGDRLKHNKALEIRHEDVKQSIPYIKNKNLHKIKSGSVYRKIKAEINSKEDRSSDDIMDLILMQRENNHYIRFVSQPLLVFICSKEQLDFVRNYNKINNELPVLHLDATGSVVRKPNPNSKRILYYVGAIQTSRKKIIPIIEFISQNHDVCSILIVLNSFKYYCIKKNMKWPIFSIVVTDFSLAIIFAVLEGWNGMTLENYLNTCFDNINNNFPENIIILKLCCAHIFKLMARDVNKFYSSKNIKTILKEILAYMHNITDFSYLKTYIKHFFIILSNKYTTSEVTDSIQYFLSNKSLIENLKDEDTKFEYSIDNNSSLYEKSPFYKIFKDIYDKVNYTLINDKSLKLNDYYSVKFAQLFLKHYVPYIPLWTAVIKKRQSNAVIENFFGLVKNNILGNKLHNKCSRFIRKIRNYVINEHREHKFDIKLDRCASKRKSRKKLPEEKWAKRIKSTHSYFKQSQITKISNINFKQDNNKTTNYLHPKKLSKDYVVSKFKKEKLFFSSYDTLNIKENVTQMYLDNFLIDFCLILFSADRNIQVLMAYQVQNLLNGGKLKTYNKTKFLFPIIDNNHWMLLFADTAEGEVSFFDPTDPSCKRAQHYFKKLLPFLQYHGKPHQFRPFTLKFVNSYPIQKDNFNCGVYVLYYCEQIIKNSTNWLMQFDPATYREYLKKLIIEKSEDISHVCLYCSEPNSELQCQSCKRFCHYICINQQIFENYICELCV